MGRCLLFMLLICCLCVSVSWAAQSPHDVITYDVGAFKVSLLSEGQNNGSIDILIGATPEMIKKLAPQKTFPNAANAFLIRTPEQNILVDTGYGAKLLDNLKALGLDPKDIDVLLITHMHRDHIGGMMKDGKKVFPGTKVYLDKIEYEYWMNEPRRRANVEEAMNAYKNGLNLFTPGDINGKFKVLLPGISAIAAYGHTPGHTMYMVESKGQKLLIWGDLTHAMAFQMPYPQVAVTYDVDHKAAVASRKKVLKYVADNKILIAGMHIAFPAMGNISSDSRGGYVFKGL